MRNNKKHHYVQEEGKKHRAESEVIPLNLEDLPILQVAVHNFEDRIGQPHAQERKGDFGMTMDLAKFEETSGY
jgi:hypothetical protein